MVEAGWRALARLLERPLRITEPAAHTGAGGGAVLHTGAIIVLGAPLGRHGGLSEIGRERVEAAAELWRRGGAPRVVVSGGVTRGAGRSEAAGMADGLVALGVPRQAILVEEQSRTTAENARCCAELLRAAPDVGLVAGGASVGGPDGATGEGAGPPGEIWLVTQPFHGRRARRYFRRAGFAPRVWPIADSIEARDPRRAVRWSLREYLAWVKALTWG